MLGEVLNENQLIAHVNKDHTFKNEHLFFRFKEDGKDQKQEDSG